MATRPTVTLSGLYEADETAWLDVMVGMIRAGRVEELDFANLGEYLTDMARRDRREVKSRLVILIAHLLKWSDQPGRRSTSWRATIITRRQELDDLIGGGVLRRHAEDVLSDAYRNAVELATAETGLPHESFPSECPYSLEGLLAIDLPA